MNVAKRVARLRRLVSQLKANISELEAEIQQLEVSEKDAGNWRDDDSPQYENTFGVRRRF